MSGIRTYDLKTALCEDCSLHHLTTGSLQITQTKTWYIIFVVNLFIAYCPASTSRTCLSLLQISSIWYFLLAHLEVDLVESFQSGQDPLSPVMAGKLHWSEVKPLVWQARALLAQCWPTQFSLCDTTALFGIFWRQPNVNISKAQVYSTVLRKTLPEFQGQRLSRLRGNSNSIVLNSIFTFWRENGLSLWMGLPTDKHFLSRDMIQSNLHNLCGQQTWPWNVTVPWHAEGNLVTLIWI